jgi:putrescine transport system permease protein
MNILSAIKARLVIIVPYVWLLFFFLLPFILVLKIALSDLEYGQPPYMPQMSFSDGWSTFWDKLSMLDLENFAFLFGDALYIKSYLSSLQIAFVSTLFTLLIGFPLAYGMARAPDNLRPTLLMLVILPFWTSFLIRVYAWIGILKQEGLLNQLLLWLGVIDTPLEILSTNTAVYIGIVYSYLPFMVLPIYSALEKMDESLVEAARDLGCTRIGAFWKVTARLAVPGVLAGCLLVFIPAMGEFVIPDLLGGSSTLMIGKTLWIEFFNNSDWTVASAIAIVLLIVLVVPIVLFQNAQARAAEAGK